MIRLLGGDDLIVGDDHCESRKFADLSTIGKYTVIVKPSAFIYKGSTALGP